MKRKSRTQELALVWGSATFIKKRRRIIRIDFFNHLRKWFKQKIFKIESTQNEWYEKMKKLNNRSENSSYPNLLAR